MPSFMYGKGLADAMGTTDLGAVRATAHTYKLALVTSAYTESKAHQFLTDLGSTILSVSGYTTKTVTPTIAVNTTSGNEGVEVTIADQTWTALGSGATIHGAVLYRDTGTGSTSPLVAFFDVTNTATNGGDVTLDFATAAAGGNVKITV